MPINVLGNSSTGRYNIFRYPTTQSQIIDTYNASLCSIQTPSADTQLTIREYRPFRLNPFSLFVPGSGYLVRAKENFQLATPGSDIPLTTNLPILGDGTGKYNFITYYFTQPTNISSFNNSLCSIQCPFPGSQATIQEYRPGRPINPFTQFLPGSGYIIRARSNFNITGTLPTPTYTITPNAVSIDEGQSVTFNIATTNLGSVTLFWSISTITGNLVGPGETSPSFAYSLSGAGSQEDALRQINITNITPTDKIYYGEYDGVTSTFTSMDVYVNNNFRSIVGFTTDRLNSQFGFSVGPNASVPDAVGVFGSGPVYLEVSDFVTPLSGQVSIVNNAGSVVATTRADNTAEGTERFALVLRSGSSTGPIVATSPTITINDTSLTPPTYNISSNASSVNEGSSVFVNVATTNFGNGTLYWTIAGIGGTINSSDFFTSIQGSVNITNNSGSFTIFVAPDSATEGAESFKVQLRQGSTSGTILSETDPITINDTSTTPVISLTGFDNADQVAYNDGWTASDDGGEGFGPWDLWSSTVPGSGIAGVSIGNATTAGFGNINVNNKSWTAFGYWLNNRPPETPADNYQNMGRGLQAPLTVGYTLSGAVAIQWRNGAKGFDLYSSPTAYSEQNKLITFNVSESYSLSTTNLDIAPYNWPYAPDSIFQFYAYQATTTTFHMTIRRPAGSNDTTTRTFTISSVPGRVQGIKFYVGNTDSSADTNNLYINSLRIYQ